MFASLKQLLHRSLWGNRADLSLSCGNVEPAAAAASSSTGTAATSSPPSTDDDLILVDDSSAAISILEGHDSGATVAISLDNTGLELVSDLVLVDALFQRKLVASITLHCKEHPVFVSDVMPKVQRVELPFVPPCHWCSFY